jgi:hypothetical protein
MKTGHAKAARVVHAAQAVLAAEEHWSDGETAPGAPQTKMRELKAAVDDYLTYRKKSWGTPGR